MATQYRDGTWGGAEPLPKALKKFMDAVESDTAKSFHVGTPQELADVKKTMQNDTAMREYLGELSDRVADLEAGVDRKRRVQLPTIQEIDKFSREP